MDRHNARCVTPLQAFKYLGREGREMPSDKQSEPLAVSDDRIATIAASIAEDGIKTSVRRLTTDYDKLAARAIARKAQGSARRVDHFSQLVRPKQKASGQICTRAFSN